MHRQLLTEKAAQADYDALYRDTQPGQNVYWNGFGDPPTITYRANFNDKEYNRQRQLSRALVKGRFQGGNLGWILQSEIELFAGLYKKPLTNPSDKQSALLNLIEREGPMTIHQMKETTGLLVKEITPALHRLQEAFLIYEDQNDGEWDRGWYTFAEMFPDVRLDRYTRHEALAIVLPRFAYRHVVFDVQMAKSFYKLPEKDIKKAAAELVEKGILVETTEGLILQEDVGILEEMPAIAKSMRNSPARAENPERFCGFSATGGTDFELFCYTAAAHMSDISHVAIKSVFAMHRNDFLVKSNEHWLKERFTHNWPDTLSYLLIDGEFRGVVAGKFRYKPELEDIILDLPPEEASALKDEILETVHYLHGASNIIKRYQGGEL